MNRIRVVELRQPVVVEGVRVTFLDANHCPGSVMILFQVPGRRPVLHCGDCRFGEAPCGSTHIHGGEHVVDPLW